MKLLLLFIKKEFTIGLRGFDRILVGVFISLVMAAMMAMGVSSVFLKPTAIKRLVPSLIWVLIFFSAAINQERNYDAESSERAIDAVALSGVNLAPLFIAKVFVGFLQLLLNAFVIFIVIEGMLGVALFGAGSGILSVLIPTLLGLCSLCVLLSVTTSSAVVRGILFPTLLLPLVLPLYFASSELTTHYLVPGVDVAVSAWYLVLGICAVIFFVGGLVLYPFAVKG